MLIDRAKLSISDYLAIFKQGLVKGNASSVAFWMEATVPHLGWNKVFSVLREALTTNPRGGAFALYHVPRLCRGNASQPSLSGTLPTRELAVEYVQLIVLYHENGHRVVDESTFDRIKGAFWDHKFQMHDSPDSISIEFELSWEDWLDSRHLHDADKRALKQHKDDYLCFGAERRQFSANEHGWTYTNSSGTARHEWVDLIGVAYLNRVIILMSPVHYPLPRSAFNEAELAHLMRWLKLAMGED